MSFTSKKSSSSVDRRPSETFHDLHSFLECQAVRSIQWSRRGWTTGAAHQPRLLRPKVSGRSRQRILVGGLCRSVDKRRDKTKSNQSPRNLCLLFLGDARRELKEQGYASFVVWIRTWLHASQSPTKQGQFFSHVINTTRASHRYTLSIQQYISLLQRNWKSWDNRFYSKSRGKL